MRGTAARVYALVGGALIAAYFALPSVPHLQTIVYDSFAAAAAAALVAGVVLHRPQAASPWLLLAGGLLLWATGDIMYDLLAKDGVTSFPSGADVLYLAGYPLLGLGLFALLRGAECERRVGTLVDAAIVAIVFGLLVWPFAIEPNLSGGSLAARVVSTSYPLFDLALLSLLARLFFLPGARTAVSRLLIGAIAATLVADVAYSTPAITGAYSNGAWYDAGWMLSYVLFGAAALHPSMRRLSETRPRASVLPRRQLVALGGTLLSLPAAFLVDDLVTGHADARVFAGAGFVLAVLYIVRIAMLVRDLDRLGEEARASERQFRAVFDSAGIGISLGEDGFLRETNPALQQMLGYDADELATKHFVELTHPDDAELDVDAQRELDEGGRDRVRLEKRYVRKDGSDVWAAVTITRSGDGTFGIGVIEDITERKELENAVRHAQKMEALGGLAGGIAHDFNNLMTAVSGYAELLDIELDANDPRRANVVGVKTAVERATALTRQLLAFSRRQVLQPRVLCLEAVLRRLEPMLRRLIPASVVLELSIGEPAAIRADESQVEQVIVNLVVNAVDALPQGGRLRIATDVVDLDVRAAAEHSVAPGRYAALRVADDGSGIDAATKARIFEPFFTTKEPGAGTGLGLSTVYGIATQSGGAVTVASHPGAGSLFTVLLPVTAEPLERRLTADVDAPGGAGETVLVVEDEEVVRGLVGRILESLGYRVLLAGGADEALATLRSGSHEFDLLLTDVVMPGMNGRALAEQVAALAPRTRILFMSGYAADALTADDLVEETALLLEKPFTADGLARAVREALAPRAAAVRVA